MQPTPTVHTDLTFFTNEPGATLLDRFKKTLEDVVLFDILVGYFRISGFHQLYESFEHIDKIRILVGLSVDRKTFDLIEAYRGQNGLDFTSHAHAKKALRERVVAEMEASEDSYRVEVGLRRFIDFLESGKLEINKNPPIPHVEVRPAWSRRAAFRVRVGGSGGAARQPYRHRRCWHDERGLRKLVAPGHVPGVTTFAS